MAAQILTDKRDRTFWTDARLTTVFLGIGALSLIEGVVGCLVALFLTGSGEQAFSVWFFVSLFFFLSLSALAVLIAALAELSNNETGEPSPPGQSDVQ